MAAGQQKSKKGNQNSSQVTLEFSPLTPEKRITEV